MWPLAPQALPLPGNGVHVWRIWLAIPAGRLEELRQTLSEEELGRAGRFRLPRDRDHFIASHGGMRAVLARYLMLRPEKLAFSYGSHQKPGLAGGQGFEDLRFNLSHAGELGLLAVAQGREVGVDIERIRTDLERDRIARRFFSPREAEDFVNLPEDLQTEAFFTCWTRKEAYLKARGEGLAMPLEQFDVTLAPGSIAVLLSTRPDPEEAGRWSLHHLAPGPGYVGALAVQGQVERLECWEWVPDNPSQGVEE